MLEKGATQGDALSDLRDDATVPELCQLRMHGVLYLGFLIYENFPDLFQPLSCRYNECSC